MKRTKSILAVILALALVLVSGVVAFATGETKGSITIDNAVKDQTYTIYRIFDIADHTSDYNGILYTVNSKWNDFFTAGAAGLNYVKKGANGYVSWKEGADAAAFAKDAYSFAKSKGIAKDGEKEATGSEVKFENLDLGYYLLHSSLDSVCSLDTTDPDVTIKEKNSKPTLKKEVKENSTNEWGKTNDANIGEDVNFKITVTANDGAPKNYVIHDKMSGGLTFNSITSVKITRNNHDNVLTKDTDYTISTDCNDGCTFEISFAENLVKPNDVIVVEYSATINASAVVSGTGNPNESWLEYGDKHLVTMRSITRTYVWKFDVLKYTTDSENKEIGLGDAEFRLYKEVDGKKSYAKVANTRITGWTEDVTKATTLVSAGDGTIEIVGLDAGTYYLEETEAPAGYNKLAAPVKVVITKEINNETNEGTATITQDDEKAAVVKVLNKMGPELPSTGGIGTTIFYIVGAVLVAAAGILLITKKRMSKTAD